MQLPPRAVVFKITPSSSAQKPENVRPGLFGMSGLAPGSNSIYVTCMSVKGMLYEDGCPKKFGLGGNSRQAKPPEGSSSARSFPARGSQSE